MPSESIQLVVTSPPDLSETVFTRWEPLFELYSASMQRCVQALRNDGVVSVIVTDRKWKATILAKHQLLTAILKGLGMELFLHKILVRNKGIDVYRLGFSHVLCFRRKDRERAGKSGSMHASPVFRQDVWGPFAPTQGVWGTRNSFPAEAVKLLIEAFSWPNDLVVDPFCGCGTTQRVALGTGREALGFETNRRLERFWKPLRSFQ